MLHDTAVILLQYITTLFGYFIMGNISALEVNTSSLQKMHAFYVAC